MKPVVDHSGSERSAQFCERLVMADVGVVAGELAASDAALLDPLRGHDAGGRRLLVAVFADDVRQLGDHFDVGSEVGEALHEGGDTSGRGVQHPVDPQGVVVARAERPVGPDVGP
ncbi:MAG: hypothetical protein ACYCUG_12905, partial [Acidimicrobiales bacterium]